MIKELYEKIPYDSYSEQFFDWPSVILILGIFFSVYFGSL